MSLEMRIFTFFRGRLVGEDSKGNRYFEEKKPRNPDHLRRWVLYKDAAEASKVPAEWHGWLHHTVDAPLLDRRFYGWEITHRPNRTGTKAAYRPKGWARSGQHPVRTSYIPWKPE